MEFFNEILIWEKHLKIGKKALTLLFLKTRKPPSRPSIYRPIALTTFPTKSFESILNIRLMFILESCQLLDIHQCGFKKRAQRLTILFDLKTQSGRHSSSTDNVGLQFSLIWRRLTTQPGGSGFSASQQI